MSSDDIRSAYASRLREDREQMEDENKRLRCRIRSLQKQLDEGEERLSILQTISEEETRNNNVFTV